MQRGELKVTVGIKDASKLRIGIVVSDYNPDITSVLLQGALDELRKWGVRDGSIVTIHVPGAFEIPYGCIKLLHMKKRLDAIVTLGCVLKGETKHDEYIANAVAHGIMLITIERRVPISFGVLTPNTLEQARARSTGDGNKGKEAAIAALSLVLA